jgi:hypothetical protein
MLRRCVQIYVTISRFVKPTCKPQAGVMSGLHSSHSQVDQNSSPRALKSSSRCAVQPRNIIRFRVSYHETSKHRDQRPFWNVSHVPRDKQIGEPSQDSSDHQHLLLPYTISCVCQECWTCSAEAGGNETSATYTRCSLMASAGSNDHKL